MWRAYIADHVKNDRSSSLSVKISALIAALLLSLLCGLFYNAWKYEVERIQLEEGSWHSRITGKPAREDIEAIKDLAHVKEVIVDEKGEQGEGPTVDIYFDDMRVTFSHTPLIAELTGVPPEKILYNYPLLAMYLVRGGEDRAPRLVFPLFLLITALASASLVTIIHNAFAVSMNAKLRQIGILSSIGATPAQIRACLLREAAALCVLPLLTGTWIGIAGSMGMIALSNILLGNDIPGRHRAVPGYHPLVLLLTVLVTVLTVWISAWLPARRLSRRTPLDAIKNAGELRLERRARGYLLPRLLGVEGELAGNALKAQRKALRTASLAFVTSFLAFTVMECFFTLSKISTRETYFERYQDVWDVMVTVEDAEVDTFGETEAVQALSGVESAIVYQKAAAERIVTEEEMSSEMKALGGFSHASKTFVGPVEGGWLVNAPILILDDRSFLAYCEQIGAQPRLDGAVLLNRIRDVTDPDFRHAEYVPYLKTSGTGGKTVSVLRPSDGDGAPYGQAAVPNHGKDEGAAEIPVLAYTDKVPALREGYATIDYYELVHFIPASLWKAVKGRLGGMEAELSICIRGREGVTQEELDRLQEEIRQLMDGKYAIGCEDRIRGYATNNKQIQGMMAVFGGFCILLAVIGVGNVFAHTSGSVRQREREFARYMSVGMTPEGLQKMFCIEAAIIALRPVLISLPLVVVAVGWMLKASYLEVGVFMAEAPLVPVGLFLLAIAGSVALAYHLAWRKVRRISLAKILRDDTML